MRWLSNIRNRTLNSTEGDSSSGGSVEIVRRVEKMNLWREQHNPLRGVSISQAISWLEQAQRGEFADVQWAYSFIERRDPDLFAIIERRTGAVLEMDWDIKTVESRFKQHGVQFDSTLAKAQQAMLRGAYDDFDNLYEAVEALCMATYRGFAHVQFLAEGKLLNKLNIIDQWNVLRAGLYGDWYWNPEARNTTAKSLSEENRLNEDAYVIRTCRRPVNEVALIKFLRQNLSAKDWDSFLEIYGIPGWIVIMPQNVPAGKETDYESAAKSVAEGGSGALPFGSDAKCADSPRGTTPFEAHMRYWTEKLVLVGTGGLLTMLAMPQGIGSGSSDEHGDAFETLARSEARRISELLQRTIDRYLLAKHFPGKPSLAYFELAANEEQDVGEMLDHVSKIYAAGGQVDWTQISEKTGYRVTPRPEPAQSSVPFGFNVGLRNRAARDIRAMTSDKADLVQSELHAAAYDALSKAQAVDLKPVADRLMAIVEMDDPGLLMGALRQLKEDLPALTAEVLSDPLSAQVIEDTISSAIVNGWAEGIATRQPEETDA